MQLAKIDSGKLIEQLTKFVNKLQGKQKGRGGIHRLKEIEI